MDVNENINKKDEEEIKENSVKVELTNSEIEKKSLYNNEFTYCW